MGLLTHLFYSETTKHLWKGKMMNEKLIFADNLFKSEGAWNIKAFLLTALDTKEGSGFNI